MLNPAALKMAALLPASNQFNGIANNYFGAASSSFTRDNIDMKINYNPTDNSSLFGRYSFSPSTIFDPQALGRGRQHARRWTTRNCNRLHS